MARTGALAARKRVEPTKQGPSLWERLRKPLIYLGVVVVGAMLFIYFDKPLPGVAFADQGNFHLMDEAEPHLPYNSIPASSGPHLPYLAQWGEHDAQIPDELFVHNLEDGGILLAYDCPDGCEEVLEGLRSAMASGKGRVLMMPYSGISHEGVPYRVAAVAWTRVLYLDEIDSAGRAELLDFIGFWEGVDHHISLG